MNISTFNLELYRRVWHRLNQSKIVTSSATPPSEKIFPVPIQVFDRLTSTNTKTWELIDRQTKTPCGVIALQQTAGKGQWGNKWASPKGGLYLSLGLSVDLDLQNLSHLVMATAWGVAKTLRYYQLPVTIKWSNDLILEHRKLGGIKIETRNRDRQITKAVVGIGLNWQNPVPDLGINLDSYYQQRASVKIDSLEELAAIASYGIFLGYNYYRTFGIAQLLVQYTAILNSLGKKVIVDDRPGKVVGVTLDGKIRIRLQHQVPAKITEVAFAPGQISLGY